MLTEIEVPPEQSAISLVSGILTDLQDLVEQQIKLTRREIEEEFRRQWAVTAIFALGLGVLFLDAMMLCLTVAHWLHWAASPVGTDPGRFPLWACYAAVVAVLCIIGSGLLAWGRARFRVVNAYINPTNQN